MTFVTVPFLDLVWLYPARTILLSHGWTRTALLVREELTTPPLPNVGSSTPALGRDRSSNPSRRGRYSERRARKTVCRVLRLGRNHIGQSPTKKRSAL